MNKQKAYIFMGNSGSGKGTQAKFFMEKLEAMGQEHYYLETGSQYRNFWKQSGYTQEVSKGVMLEGKLQPAFLSIHTWAHQLIDYMNSEKHLVADGTPRMLREAMVLDEAFHFYGIEKPNVVYLHITREVAKERLAGRGRADDTEELIDKRLDWYDEYVAPTVEFFRNNEYYNFIEINGEQTIEEIAKEVEAKTLNNE